MTQYARPASDTSPGSWTTTPLWSKVDDDLVSSPSGDGVTIASADNTAGDTAQLALGSISDPGATTGHVMRVRWNKSASGGHQIDAVCNLIDATNGTIAAISVTNIGNTEQENTLTLNATQVGNITNYAGLSVSFVRNGDTGGPPGNRRSLVVEAFQFEAPDAVVSYTLPADLGSYSLSGSAAGLLADRLMASGEGAFTLAGQDVSLVHGFIMLAEQAGFGLTGQQASLLLDRLLAADVGAITFSGQPAGLLTDRILAAEAGAFSVSGSPVALLAGRLLSATAGAFTLTGQDVVLDFSGGSYIMTAESGSYILSGQTPGLLAARVLGAEPAAFSLSGQEAGLLQGLRLAAEQGAYFLSGSEASLLVDRLLGAGVGSFTLAGQVVTLVFAGVPTPTPSDRVFVIDTDDRTFIVFLESRTLSIPAEDRVFAVQTA